MHFSDTSPGASWQPESAARYNAVNSLLRRAAPVEPLPGAAADSRVDVYNASALTINAFSPAAVTGARFPADPARQAGKPLLEVIPAADDSLPWGVVIQDILPGSCGVMILSGTAPAHFTGSGRFVAPSAAGLSAGESGSALAVLPPEDALPGLILLGGASSSSAAADDEYMGYFKLQPVSPYSIQLINGFAPLSAYCGTSDVPGVEQIPVMSLSLPEAVLYNIYLVFFYDVVSTEYSVELRYDLPENMAFYRFIGTFDRGSVTQSYKNSDSRMTFGDEWFLK